MLNGSKEEVSRIASSISMSGAASGIIKKELNDVVDNLDELKHNTDDMKLGLSDIVKFYETTEAQTTEKKYSDLVAEYGENGTCNGMDKKRIAKELYAHVIGYYSASTLEKLGIYSILNDGEVKW